VDDLVPSKVLRHHGMSSEKTKKRGLPEVSPIRRNASDVVTEPTNANLFEWI
jgi:hypothetical protein